MATERIIQHIERLREKPEHVRHRIAILTAIIATGLVAVTWMTAMATSGVFALKTTSPVEDPAKETIAESASKFSNLLGAAGAAFGASSSEPTLNVQESRTTSTLNTDARIENNTHKTVIPF